MSDVTAGDPRYAFGTGKVAAANTPVYSNLPIPVASQTARNVADTARAAGNSPCEYPSLGDDSRLSGECQMIPLELVKLPELMELTAGRVVWRIGSFAEIANRSSGSSSDLHLPDAAPIPLQCSTSDASQPRNCSVDKRRQFRKSFR
jgi:hypothetical protein